MSTPRLIPAAMAVVLFAALAAGQASAQPPSLTNGRVTVQPASASFEQQVRQIAAAAPEPTWIGWSAPARNPERDNCCWSTNNGITNCGCRLEETGSTSSGSPAGVPGKVELEPKHQLLVLVRAQDKLLQRVVAYSDSCNIDAGGRPVIWIEGAPPAGSVALMAKISTETQADGKLAKIATSAMAVLAQHADPSADRALIEMARNGTATRVREQALFWLAQAAGQKAIPTIVGAIDQDPDTDVKKRAVFALSQLPKDDGVPRLIDVARTNRNPEVRKQAMFWLGQSHDPRALRFFEEILTK